MGKEALPFDKDYILNILEDVFFYIKQGQIKFRRDDIDHDRFMKILEPFFITSFQSLSQSLQKQKFKKFFSILPSNPHSIIITNILNAFNPSYICLYSIEIVKMIQKNPQDTKYKLYQLLLQKIRTIVFNKSGQFIILVWTDITHIKDIQLLMDLLGYFSQIIFRNLSGYQKNKFYTLILQKFNNLFQNFRKISKSKIQKFQKFLTEIIIHTQNIKDIVTLQPFIMLITYFPQKSKQQISYNIIKSFVNNFNQKIKDPLAGHILLTLMKNLSGYKDKGKNKSQEVQKLVLKFIDLVQYVKEYEELLNFYAQIRANFGYYQNVTVKLIYKAASLTYRVRNANNGKVTNKLVAFLQAAVAFCYITVPVLQSQQKKLKMYLFLGQVSLCNNLISQSTSLIKTCITQLSQCSLKSDIQIYSIFFRLISFMIVIPDDPQKDYLFLFNGLFQSFQVSKFKSSSLQPFIRFQFYTNCITYLSCQAQQKLPFHLQGVTSNDGLFKQQQFKSTLVEKIYQIFTLLQNMVEKMDKNTGNDGQAQKYMVNEIPECVMKIIDVFEESERVKILVSKVVKLFTNVKDKVIRGENQTYVTKFKKSVDGLNEKLKMCNYNFKVL